VEKKYRAGYYSPDFFLNERGALSSPFFPERLFGKNFVDHQKAFSTITTEFMQAWGQKPTIRVVFWPNFSPKVTFCGYTASR